MRLALQLVATLVLVITGLLVADGLLLVRRAREDYEAGVEHDASVVGRMLGDLVAEVWRTQGEAQALHLLEDPTIGGPRGRIRWVWLDASPGTDHAPRATLDPDAARALREERLRAEDDEGQHYSYVPVETPGERPGALEIVEPRGPFEAYRVATFHRVLLLTVVMIAIAALVTVVLGVRLIGRRLHQLQEKVRRVGAGDLGGPVDVGGRDELTQLGEALNRMCVRLEAAEHAVRAETEGRIRAVEQLRRADRLRIVGQLSSGMAHELGTPLNVVSARAALIASGRLGAEDVVHSARIVKSQCDRMTALIRQLLDFARPRPAQRAPVDLCRLVEEAEELVSSLHLEGEIRWADGRPPSLPRVHADAGQIQQVIVNLLVNALQAMPDGGTVTLDARDGDYVSISIEDEGEGIAPELLDQVFEPFFSTKDVGKGTGLGLSVAHGIVREHGGRIEVRSEPGRGSCFTVYLPREVEDVRPSDDRR